MARVVGRTRRREGRFMESGGGAVEGPSPQVSPPPRCASACPAVPWPACPTTCSTSWQAWELARSRLPGCCLC